MARATYYPEGGHWLPALPAGRLAMIETASSLTQNLITLSLPAGMLTTRGARLS